MGDGTARPADDAADGPILLGPFHLLEALGAGGAGTVWRARVPGQPLDIAVKLLHQEHWDSDTLLRFLDEARAAAGLDHQHLAQVLDFGVVEDNGHQVPYLAMDIASGGTLLDAAPDLSWAQLSEAILAVMDGLAHAHARGVVHLDVKAENILLGNPSDGRPGWRVVDFGIAHAMGSATGARVAGTPTHMAPEQWTASWREFGPWTDVYALGCMVWQLVTGQPLYDGDVMQIAQRHMVGALPPFEPARPVPAELATWLARALQTHPRRRFRHLARASDAWRALGDPVSAMGPVDLSTIPLTFTTTTSKTFTFDDRILAEFASDWDDDDTGAAVDVGWRPLPSHWSEVEQASVPLSMGGLGLGAVASRIPPLVGRTSHRDLLWTLLTESVLEGAPRYLVLHGPTGCGKTRLASWLGQTALLGNHAQLLLAHHSAVPDADHGLRAAIRRRLRVDGLSLAEVRPIAQTLVEDAAATDPEDLEVVVEVLAGATEPGRASIARVLSLMARSAPLILVIDDAMFGAESMAIASALRGPILVLATWEGEPVLSETWRRLEVDGLEPAEMRQLVEGMLPLTTRAAARLCEHTGGNPREALQRILTHTQNGDLIPLDDRYELAPDAEAPAQDIDALWAARLEAMLAGCTNADREALMVAAALGVSVQDEEWVAALGEAPSAGVQSALFAARLAVKEPRATRWRFVHPRVRAVLEGWARAEGLWLGIHARCAQAMVALGRDRGRIGVHLLEAGDPEEAIPHLLHATEDAMSSGRAHEGAVQVAHLDRAFAAADRGPLDDDRIRAMVVAARIDRQRLGPRASLLAADAALERARANGNPELIAMAGRTVAMGRRSARMGDNALQLVESLLDEVGARCGDVQRSRLLAALGVCLCDLAPNAPEVIPRARAVLAEAVALGGLSAAQRGDAILYSSRLEVDIAVKRPILLEALETYREAGTLVGQALTHYDLASACRTERDLDSALSHYRESARLFDLTGAQATYTAQLGIGTVLMGLGRHAEAAPVFQVVVNMGRRVSRIYLSLLAAAGLASCAAHAGDWDLVDAWLGQAEDLARSLEMRASELDQTVRPGMEAAQIAGQQARLARMVALMALVETPAEGDP